MAKKTEIWGNCPYRRLGWVRNGGGWSYICGKTDEGCSPNYCLGPDEDRSHELYGTKMGQIHFDEFELE